MLRIVVALFLVFSTLAFGAELYVGSTGARYYSIANEDSKAQGIVPAGEELSVLSVRGEWIYVSSANEEYVGWVRKSETSVTKPEPPVLRAAEQGSSETNRYSEETTASSNTGESGFFMGFVLSLIGLGMLAAKSMGSRLFGVFLIFLGFASCSD